jgi:hypothetical protein
MLSFDVFPYENTSDLKSFTTVMDAKIDLHETQMDSKNPKMSNAISAICKRFSYLHI